MSMDDNEKLWELLGKTRQPSVSPFFARNVLRAVRMEEDAPSRSLSSRFARLGRSAHRWTWRVAIAGTCAVAILATLGPSTLIRHHHHQAAQAPVDRQIVGNPDYEVIKHLDELVADEESSVWLDNSVH